MDEIKKEFTLEEKEEFKKLKTGIVSKLLKMNTIFPLKSEMDSKEVFKFNLDSGEKVILFINKNEESKNKNCFAIPTKFGISKVDYKKNPKTKENVPVCYAEAKEYDIITDKDIVKQFVDRIYEMIENNKNIRYDSIKLVISSESANKDVPVYRFYNHNNYDKSFFYESELDCFFKDNLKDLVEVLKDKDSIVSKILDFYVKILGNITAIPVTNEYDFIPYFPTIIKDVNFKVYNPVYLMINCCSYDFLNTIMGEIKLFEECLRNAETEDENDTTIDEGIEKDLKNIQYILKEIKNEFKEGYLNK